MYKFRVWLSNKISSLALGIHPESKKNKKVMLKLLMDRLIYGYCICRINPKDVIK